MIAPHAAQPGNAWEALRRAAEGMLLRAETTLHRWRRTAGTGATERAGEVATAAGNAAHVPREVIQDAQQALASWSRAAVALLGIVLAAVVFGTVVLVLLTVGLVVALNMLLGDPWGTLTLAALYVLLAVVLIVVMRRAARRANAEAKGAAAHASEDVRHATEPPRHPRPQA